MLELLMSSKMNIMIIAIKTDAKIGPKSIPKKKTAASPTIKMSSRLLNKSPKTC